MNRPSQREINFVRFLEERLGVRSDGAHREPTPEQRSTRATLRRALGKPPGSVPETYSYVEPWLGPQAAPWQVENFYSIAALMAWHPVGWHEDDTPQSPTNLGASFVRLARTQREFHGEVPAGLERRLVAMLNASQTDLTEHLRHAIGLLKTHEVPVNWVQLLADLRSWEWSSREVQRRWAYGFWGSAPQDTERQGAVEEDERDAG
ncbi:type I-E CRISPR-associated protein Cse2/CasB [Limnochorda pilosa]|uniref:CRISPR-associated protein Cse2 n=1 Tax=Limnochorda pilosa TaxID=1555112 RepID=A0A0K2SJP0_LIMPI|nr:type I-E CRISPR-associated protein Cse2/CasB [Limnochorda pilosa]BAS27310.1 CRISPR-associated protein Cse2 [Limnochorda pilosa]